MKTDRNILRIAVPSIVSNITVPLLGLVDTSIAGHLGAPAYIGAIAVGGMFFNMIYWIFGFLRMGTGGLTAQAYGAGRRDEADRTLLRSLGLALLAGLALIALHRPLAEVFFYLLGPTPEVEALARRYYTILIWGAPAMLCLYSLIGWFLGMQNAKFPMFIAITQNVVNIGASLALVVGAGWKVEGVATGTLIAQYAGLLMACALWRRHFGLRLKQEAWRATWDGRALRRFFSVNRDIFFRTLCLVGVSTYFTASGARQGELILAVNALLMQFFMLFSYIMDGFAYAGEALGGRCYGAGDVGEFRRLTRRLFVWGLGLAGLFTLAYGLGGGLLLGVLTDETSVVRAAETFLPYAVAIPLTGFAAFLFDGLFIGTTSTRGMLLAAGGATAVFFLVECGLTARLGNHALWTAFLLYLLLRGVIQAACYGRVCKKIVHLRKQRETPGAASVSPDI